MTSPTQEALYLRHLLKEMGVPQVEPTVIHVDSLSAAELVNKQGTSSTTRHIAHRVSWLNSQVVNRQVRFIWVDTRHQWADFLTKPLTGERFLTCRNAIGMTPAASDEDIHYKRPKGPH